MWYEQAKAKYGRDLVDRLMIFLGGNYSTKMNDATGEYDWYLPTGLVMAFERRENLPNDQRLFPQP